MLLDQLGVYLLAQDSASGSDSVPGLVIYVSAAAVIAIASLGVYLYRKSGPKR